MPSCRFCCAPPLSSLLALVAGHIAWHADEVRAHGPRPLVVCITLCPGGARRFELRHPRTGATAACTLAHGSALVMAGATQAHWQHRLPEAPAEADAPQRIALTFRSIVAGFETERAEADRMKPI